MTARQLYEAGRLDEAVQALNAEVRENPTDAQRRTFLFELLCFAGNYDRADRILETLAAEGADARMGALLYRAALHAERTRQAVFEKEEFPEAGGTGEAEVRGCLNGTVFTSIADSDPRIGPRLEVFAAGQYLWIPFSNLASVRMQAPKRLRDLVWAPAVVRTGPSFKGTELGEVLIPVLSPFSSRHPDDAVRLGRATVWEERGGQSVPFGQKSLETDSGEVSLLEVRSLEIEASS